MQLELKFEECQCRLLGGRVRAPLQFYPHCDGCGSGGDIYVWTVNVFGHEGVGSKSCIKRYCDNCWELIVANNWLHSRGICPAWRDGEPFPVHHLSAGGKRWVSDVQARPLERVNRVDLPPRERPAPPSMSFSAMKENDGTYPKFARWFDGLRVDADGDNHAEALADMFEIRDYAARWIRAARHAGLIKRDARWPRKYQRIMGEQHCTPDMLYTYRRVS